MYIATILPRCIYDICIILLLLLLLLDIEDSDSGKVYPKGKPIEHSKTPNAVCSYVVVSANGRAIGPAYGKTSLH